MIWILLSFSQFSHLVLSDSLWPHGLKLQASRSFTVSRSLLKLMSIESVMPTSSSSAVPFSCLQSFPAPGSFPLSQFFASGGQSFRASASVLPMNNQNWFPLGWTSLISLLSRGFSRVFSNTTVQKYQFFDSHLSGTSLVAQLVKTLPAVQETWVRFLGQEDPL